MRDDPVFWKQKMVAVNGKNLFLKQSTKLRQGNKITSLFYVIVLSKKHSFSLL